MSYAAPIDDILLALRAAAGDGSAADPAIYPELADGFDATLLGEAARFADDVLAPINRIGDQHGARLENGVVRTAPGWREAFARWREGGWAGLAAPQDAGGMGLPHVLQAACFDMWSAANMAFMLNPLLTSGGIDAIAAHAAPALREAWLPQLVSGELCATMNLTEPQAGSDLAALRCRAERAADGTYRIRGNKIFITYGDHDLTENIVHLVLARLPDAPAGVRGISLFLAPKILPDGARNDLRCTGLEHKLGVHASPTCSMTFGEGEGARAWLVGEEHRGLSCMFTMMNAARLAVGIEGVGACERATQQALAYARERRQGRAASWRGEGMAPIVNHPDVARMLLLMASATQAARMICYRTADALDVAARGAAEAARREAADRASLLTPVAKAFSTDLANEVASLGVQVHGGAGFIEETGAAQHMRDARIAAIYEGANGVQAIDLATRKLALGEGEAAAREIAAMRARVARFAEREAEAASRLDEAVEALARATAFMRAASEADRLAGATPYLRLFGLASGGAGLADLARVEAPGAERRKALARFYADHWASAAPALAAEIMTGGASVREGALALGAHP